MSNIKAEGKKIAIKFTENLIGDVTEKFPYKLYRFYKWEFYDSQHSGNRVYLYEIELYFEENKYDNSNVKEVTGSSQSSTTYTPAKVFDDSTSTHWRTSTSFDLPHWLIVEFNNSIAIDNFKWYVTGNYNPDSFILFGSIDGENWDKLHEDNSPNSNGWHSFDIDKKGNESAFVISGEEYLYVQGLNHNGDLVDKEYEVDSIEPHLTEERTILLTMKQHNEFNNVVGDLTVVYNAIDGDLSGHGGRVENFEKTFTPEGLKTAPTNPGVTESISVAPVEIIVDFSAIEYIDGRDLGETNIISVAPIAPFVAFLYNYTDSKAWLETETQLVKFDANGELLPESETITMTSVTQVMNNPSYNYKIIINEVEYDDYFTIDDNQININMVDLLVEHPAFTEATVKMAVIDGGFTLNDYITIVKVQENSGDIVSFLTNEYHVVVAIYKDGLESELKLRQAETNIKVYQGFDDITNQYEFQHVDSLGLTSILYPLDDNIVVYKMEEDIGTINIFGSHDTLPDITQQMQLVKSKRGVVVNP